MSWEYWLVPTSPANRFSDEAIRQMQRRLIAMDVAYAFDERTYFIFASREQREQSSPTLRQRGQGVFHIYCSIELGEKEILLRAVGSPPAEDHLRDFARWCQSEWPSDLRTAGKVITPEEI